jgi:hypothetical protein
VIDIVCERAGVGGTAKLWGDGGGGNGGVHWGIVVDRHDCAEIDNVG